LQSTTSVPSGTPAAWMPRLASRITPSAISKSPAKIEIARRIDDPGVGEQDRAAV
jgi:hypothetical protein